MTIFKGVSLLQTYFISQVEEIKIETLNRIFVLKCPLIVSSVSKLSTLVTWITELTARNMCPNSPVLHAPLFHIGQQCVACSRSKAKAAADGCQASCNTFYYSKSR